MSSDIAQVKKSADEKITKIFERVQTHHSHRRSLKSLVELKNDLDDLDLPGIVFNARLYKYVRPILVQGGCTSAGGRRPGSSGRSHLPVELLLNFVATFVTRYDEFLRCPVPSNLDEEEDDRPGSDLLIPFLAYLARDAYAKNRSVRCRSLDLVNRLMKRLSTETDILSHPDFATTIEALLTSLKTRLRDKSAQVRENAVYAIHRFQYDPAVRDLLFKMLEHGDNSSMVRCALVSRIAFWDYGVSVNLLIRRCCDTDDKVRCAVFKKFQTVKIEKLVQERKDRLAEFESSDGSSVDDSGEKKAPAVLALLFQHGLADRSEKAKIECQKLLTNWYQEFVKVNAEPPAAEEDENAMQVDEPEEEGEVSSPAHHPHRRESSTRMDVDGEPSPVVESRPRRTVFDFLNLFRVFSPETEATGEAMYLNLFELERTSLTENLEFQKNDPDILLTPASALYWRCACEFLQSNGKEADLQKVFEEFDSVSDFAKMVIRYAGEKDEFIQRQLLVISRHIHYDEFGRGVMMRLIRQMLKTYKKAWLYVDELVSVLDVVVPEPESFRELILEVVDSLRPSPASDLDTIVSHANSVRAMTILSRVLWKSREKLTGLRMDHFTALIDDFLVPSLESNSVEQNLAVKCIGQFCAVDLQLTHRYTKTLFAMLSRLARRELRLNLVVVEELVRAIGDILAAQKMFVMDEEKEKFNHLLFIIANFDSEDMQTVVFETICKAILRRRIRSRHVLTSLVALVGMVSWSTYAANNERLKQMIRTFFEIYPWNQGDLDTMALSYRLVLRYTLSNGGNYSDAAQKEKTLTELVAKFLMLANSQKKGRTVRTTDGECVRSVHGRMLLDHLFDVLWLLEGTNTPPQSKKKAGYMCKCLGTKKFFSDLQFETREDTDLLLQILHLLDRIQVYKLGTTSDRRVIDMRRTLREVLRVHQAGLMDTGEDEPPPPGLELAADDVAELEDELKLFFQNRVAFMDRNRLNDFYIDDFEEFREEEEEEEVDDDIDSPQDDEADSPSTLKRKRPDNPDEDELSRDHKRRKISRALVLDAGSPEVERGPPAPLPPLDGDIPSPSEGDRMDED